MSDLKGQFALVTGASRGVGRGVAVVLTHAGATVFATGRTIKQNEPGEGIHSFACDHTDDRAVEAVIRQVEASAWLARRLLESAEGRATPRVWRVEAGSSISGRGKGCDACCVGSFFKPKSNRGTSTIGSGAAEAAMSGSTTWSYCTRIAIGRSTRIGRTDGMGCVPRGAFEKA
jgi:hypothetical protein